MGIATTRFRFYGRILAASAALALPGAILAAEPTPKTARDFVAPNAVRHSGVRDQGNAGFCWAYSTTAMLEAELLRERGVRVDLSEEYVGFFHVYEQLLRMAPQFFAMEKRAATDADSGGIRDFLNGALIYFLFHPSEGAPNLELGVDLIEKYGIVPESAFHFKAKGGLFASRIQGRVRRFINQVLRDPTQNAEFRKRAADGSLTNEPLPEKILVALAKVYTNETLGTRGQASAAEALLAAYRGGFRHAGVRYDPRSFAKNYLGFARADYEHWTVTPETERARLDLLLRTLAKGEPAQLGFMLYDGYAAVAKDPGVLQTTLCEGKPCAAAGGHAVLIVNRANDARTRELGGFVIQNSWGEVGLDARGRAGEAKGFQIVALEYLRKIYGLAEAKPEHRNWTFLVRR